MSLYLQVTMSSSVPCQTCWAKCPRDKAGGMSTKGVLSWKTAWQVFVTIHVSIAIFVVMEGGAQSNTIPHFAKLVNGN